MSESTPVRPEQWSANFNAREFASKGREFKPGSREPYRRLVLRALQPIRDHVGRPVLVVSGQRWPDVNGAVGGASNSRHLPPDDRAPDERDGVAADIRVIGFSQGQTHALYLWIVDHAEELGIGAAEFYPENNFIHVDSRNSSGLVTWADKSGRAAWEANHV